MSFIGYMLCIIAALFAGVVLDRVILKIEDDRKIYEYASICFEDEKSAEIVLQALEDALKRNGMIRVYDYYFVSGTCNKSINDFKFGWTDINSFSIDKLDDGRYVINPSDPHLLEN